MTQTQVQLREQNGLLPAPAGGSLNIGQILDAAIRSGQTPEALEKLVGLAERLADRESDQQLTQALARFQQACPPITKMREAKIVTKAGGSYGYRYADLDAIVRVIRPLMSKEGLTFAWDSSEENGKITCVCIIRHIGGASTRATFVSPTDSAAAMSGAQKNAAALTYARRQALVQALGIITCDEDADGAASALVGPISDKQLAELEAAIRDAGVNMDRFYQHFQIAGLVDLPRARFDEAMNLIEQKRRVKK